MCRTKDIFSFHDHLQGGPRKQIKSIKKPTKTGIEHQELSLKEFFKDQLLTVSFPENAISVDALGESDTKMFTKLEQEFDSMFGTSFFLI